ncbi:MAG TPA: NAD(P)/FAD-dependent oxidoreductase [Polyangiaceae bacterium]|nr:NAD(P)/FAD-dependent oxidoreductase [Polyangiaceae bacterium]
MLKRHVVVVGGGFGGLGVAKALRKAPVRVTLIDRSNHHLFQPLLYQVAMAGLSPAEIAVPIRSVLYRQENTRVLLDEVLKVNVEQRTVVMRESGEVGYDYLVIATGARTNYFGHDEWVGLAPGLKDLDDAVEIRRRVLLAFEAAERETDEATRRRHLTFVVIGGGATGVELAGAIAELASFVLARDFRAIHPDATRVLLLEGGPTLLAGFDPSLAASAAKSLKEMGVSVRTEARVTQIDARGVNLGEERIDASTVLWAAGVCASELGATLGVPLDRSGRIPVNADCSVPGHDEVFCIGDAASFTPAGSERSLPGVSPVAMQQARFVAKTIAASIDGKPRTTFNYVDKGSMATIGRSRAVVQLRGLRFSGFFAWLTWLLVHIFYLIDFRNRVVVLLNWAWSYVTYKRGARLITGHRLGAGAPPRRAP